MPECARWSAALRIAISRDLPTNGERPRLRGEVRWWRGHMRLSHRVPPDDGLCDESIAPAADGLQVASRFGIVRERLADGADARRQGGRAHGAHAPHVPDELLLRNEPIRVLHQVGERIEGLARDLDPSALPP